MPATHRTLLGGLCILSLLAGCNFDVATGSSGETASVTNSGPGTAGSAGSSTPPGIGTVTDPAPLTDSVNATASVAGTVAVVAGASQTITVSFTSADGRPISGLALSNTTLPPDWSGPSDFTCTVTGSGNNCVLTLTYAPTAVETGTLKIGYVYAGDQTPPPGSIFSIPYAGTASNNVVATPAPIGQINAASGSGTQSVSVTFTTDDGHAATGLTILTGLSSLPAGWSATTPGFSCAIISNGNGCQLVLKYAPQRTGSGTLTLGYGYTDSNGVMRTGAVNLPYSTTTNGSVVATVSPAGQVTAVQKTGSQPVTIGFTTDDGETANDLVLLAPLSSLPAGWSSATNSFTCTTVRSGGGCQLALSFAPGSLSSGTVQLEFGYMNPAGTFTTGSVDLPYAATTNDNIVATAAPAGQIEAIVGVPASQALVTFSTDDARPATALQVTTDLATLPAGWTSTDSSFTCAGVVGGTSCQLSLTYAPGAADNGTVTLRYTYQDNAGQSKSGSVNIPYRATTDDSVVGTPTQSPVTVVAGMSTSISVAFATDDGNPASALTVSSGLTALPAGWSADGTFTCSSVSAGVACQLALSYQPTVADAGSLVLGFTYANDSGVVKSGTVSIPYTATP